MRVLIVEDEKPAAGKLLNSLARCSLPVEVVAVLTGVQESIQWLKANSQPDLIFMDIELSDGTAFQIHKEVTITCPVIFTTAYDEYWQEAFEHNGIDYLLKPIRENKLEAALKKYSKLKEYFTNNLPQLIQWSNTPNATPSYKKRFLIKRGIDYISIKTDDIAYFYATQKLVCLVDNKSQKFILDDSLSDIERQLDPAHFYRVNRKFLVHLNAIRKIRTFPKSKLQLELDPEINEEIIIPQENVAAFKDWMDK